MRNSSIFLQRNQLNYFVIILMTLSLLLSSCSPSKPSAEVSLLGGWKLSSSQGRDFETFQDLYFKENGQLFLDDGTFGTYLISAPGFLHIDVGEFSEFVKFELNKDSLVLYFDNGLMHFERANSPKEPHVRVPSISDSAPTEDNPIQEIFGNMFGKNEVITPQNVNRIEELGHIGKGTPILLQALPKENTLLLATTIGIYFYDLPSLKEIRNIESGSILSATISPDSRIVASGGGDQNVRLWDARSGKLLKVLEGHSGSIDNLEFSPDSEILVSAGQDKTIRLWAVKSGRTLGLLEGHSKTIIRLKFSPDGKTLASGSNDETIRLWDTLTAVQLAVIPESLINYLNSVLFDGGLSFSSDGKTLATTGADDNVRLWDARTGEQLAFLESRWVTDFEFSPDGQTIATGGSEPNLRLWNTSTWEPLSVIKLQDHPAQGYTSSPRISNLAYSPDGKTLALACSDSTVRLWDSLSNDEVILDGHSKEAVKVIFSSDGKFLISQGADGTIRSWDTSKKVQVAVLGGYANTTSDIDLSPDGLTLASVDSSSQTYVWDVKFRTMLGAIETSPYHHSSSIAISPDGKMLVTSDWNSAIKFWDFHTREQVGDIKYAQSGGNLFSFSPDGKTLASTGIENSVWLGSVQIEEQLALLKGHTDRVTSLAFSPDGNTLASGSGDTTVRLWDARTGDSLAVLGGQTKAINSIAFSPNSETLASARGTSVVLWDISSREQLVTIEGHTKIVTDVAYSPDGKILASASGDNTIRLSDAETGEELAIINGPEGEYGFTCLAFTLDGKLLFSGGVDGIVRIWGAP